MKPKTHSHTAAEPSVTCAAHIVDALLSAGVKRVFGIPGGPISPLLDALIDSPIEFIACQHESMAVYAAGGAARAQKEVGVVCVTSGPGVLNALTGLAAARMDEFPLVLLVGETAAASRGRTALQDGRESGLDIAGVTRSLTKRSLVVERAWSGGPVVADALRLAGELPHGPVVVRIPVDVARSPSRASVTDTVPPPPAAPSQGAEWAGPIAASLLAARRPLMLLGGRAVQAGCGYAARRLAELSACPVATDLEAKGLFPESHPLSVGLFGVGSSGRAEAYMEAGIDTLLVVGARLDDTTTGGFNPWLRPDAASVFQLDFNSDRFSRSFDFDHHVCGDLNLVLDSIVAELTELRTPVVPLQLAATRPPPPPVTRSESPFDPRSVPRQVQRSLPPDTFFVSDIGNHLLFAAQGLELDGPRFLSSLGLGGMGSGLGTAIGMSFADPERSVVCFCGDGTLLMSGNELATCARNDVGPTVIVFNDGQWGMVEHGSQRVYGRSLGWQLPHLDIVDYARSLGVRGLRVESEADFEKLAQLHGRLPLVVDVPIDPSVKASNPRDVTLNFENDA